MKTHRRKGETDNSIEEYNTVFLQTRINWNTFFTCKHLSSVSRNNIEREGLRKKIRQIVKDNTFWGLKTNTINCSEILSIFSWG